MTVFVDDPDFVLHVGDALEVLASLPDESVHCVVTSPPYWGLRDYGTGSWDGGDEDCDHKSSIGASSSSGLNGSLAHKSGEVFTPFRDVCGKCGARRTDHQLGLEKSPDEYVSNMVAVFREVRRVLRRDGTCWLNIGDSYASGEIGRHDGRVEGSEYGAKHPGPRQQARLSSGLKPKDLVGIPWRLAFALQQPYYTGRIKDERDRIWLAAMVDAEGCIHIHKRNAGADSGAKFTKKDGTERSYARTQDTYGVMVSIDNTSKEIIDRCEAIVGQGSRYVHEKGVGKANRKQTLYRLTLTGQQSRDLLRELYPHLVGKRQEARIAYHSPSSGDKAEAAWQAIKALHNGTDTTVDYPAPETMFEPGWYIRSDIIWGKPNPMPESVTDRPTKAHEYLFLLTRSPRYFYDADAIREDFAPKTLTHRGNGKAAGKVGQQDGTGKVASGNFGDWDKARTAYPPPRPQDETLDGSEGEAPRGADGRRATAVKGADGSLQHRDGERWPNGGRNKRSVWEIATEPYPDAHFATFPQALVEPCVKAGCPVGGTVLDPFMGSGTTAIVARRLGRRAIGIELSREYATLAATRLQQLSLLADA